MDSKAMTFYPRGGVEVEKYYRDTKLHREDGPALIRYNEDGTVSHEYYFIENEIHREDGPAVVRWGRPLLSGYFGFYKRGQELDINAFSGVIDPSTGEVLDQTSFDLIYNML